MHFGIKIIIQHVPNQRFLYIFETSQCIFVILKFDRHLLVCTLHKSSSKISTQQGSLLPNKSSSTVSTMFQSSMPFEIFYILLFFCISKFLYFFIINKLYFYLEMTCLQEMLILTQRDCHTHRCLRGDRPETLDHPRRLQRPAEPGEISRQVAAWEGEPRVRRAGPAPAAARRNH